MSRAYCSSRERERRTCRLLVRACTADLFFYPGEKLGKNAADAIAQSFLSMSYASYKRQGRSVLVRKCAHRHVRQLYIDTCGHVPRAQK